MRVEIKKIPKNEQGLLYVFSSMPEVIDTQEALQKELARFTTYDINSRSNPYSVQYAELKECTDEILQYLGFSDEEVDLYIKHKWGVETDQNPLDSLNKIFQKVKDKKEYFNISFKDEPDFDENADIIVDYEDPNDATSFIMLWKVNPFGYYRNTTQLNDVTNISKAHGKTIELDDCDAAIIINKEGSEFISTGCMFKSPDDNRAPENIWQQTLNDALERLDGLPIHSTKLSYMR